MVDKRDVAAVESVVLTESGHVGERYDITGPEALSYQRGSKTNMSRTSPDRPELASVGRDSATLACACARSSRNWSMGRLLWTSTGARHRAMPDTCLRQRLQQSMRASPVLARIVRSRCRPRPTRGRSHSGESGRVAPCFPRIARPAAPAPRYPSSHECRGGRTAAGSRAAAPRLLQPRRRRGPFGR